MKEGDLARYLALALLWASWCGLHSLMIALRFTEGVKRLLGGRYRYYRFFYVLVAAATLLPLAAWSRTVKGPEVVNWEGPWRVLQGIILLTSLALFLAGGKRYDLLQLLGIRQIREREDYRALSATGRIDRAGIHGVVRHPWYSGGLLIVWARDIDMAVLIVNSIISLYFVVGTVLEERKLVAEFGDEYRGYQEEVSMLFPGKWITARLLRRKGTTDVRKERSS